VPLGCPYPLDRKNGGGESAGVSPVFRSSSDV